jgi:hypothetical protein
MPKTQERKDICMSPDYTCPFFHTCKRMIFNDPNICNLEIPCKMKTQKTLMNFMEAKTDA